MTTEITADDIRALEIRARLAGRDELASACMSESPELATMLLAAGRKLAAEQGIDVHLATLALDYERVERLRDPEGRYMTTLHARDWYVSDRAPIWTEMERVIAERIASGVEAA